jgi:hypothetical protein
LSAKGAKSYLSALVPAEYNAKSFKVSDDPGSLSAEPQDRILPANIAATTQRVLGMDQRRIMLAERGIDASRSHH